MDFRQELNQVRLRSGADMKRKLGWYDLVALGVGGMLGVGVFVTTGPVALHHSGPSVFISYIIAGISALLSSMCYTEFSVEIPVAGGAFSYLRVTFGEFVGYFAGANILMEYVLSNAAVSRSFTDTKESSILNFVMTIFHVVFFGFIIIAGFLKGSAKNLVNPDGLAPFGVKGVLDGAAQVYFSYIGYDSVSTMAEEISNPSKSLPVGIMGSVFIVSGLYCLMSFALCMMLPYNQIPEKASFAIAFQRMGWKWASNIVGAGASLGIVAFSPSCHARPSSIPLCHRKGKARATLVSQGASFNRHPIECYTLLGFPLWLLFWFLGGDGKDTSDHKKLNPHMYFQSRCWGTVMFPKLSLLNMRSSSTIISKSDFIIMDGAFTASIALFTELEIVVDMVNLCTLLVFYLVANALIYRRYVITVNNPPFHTLLFLSLLSCSSIAFSLSWKLKQWWGLPLFGGIMIIITACFHYFVPYPSQPSKWSVPFMPWPAAMSIFLNVFLMTTLKKLSLQRFGVWSCLIILFYVLYGVHSTYRAEEMGMDAGGVNPNSSAQQTKLDIQLL
ncbi:Cationic amino acid transporter 6, chloroplastic [Vitis vinifera]|uniref:Cationic amino acid transporter 6, chloroplastic n=1 Tax=Vitis vinifera TaxID=29760 RepID=A0A438ETB8_VITVI|nr:Cationic amino acid transporter 6, chloroplastic [Vitis vinifera]